jgi:hypothetical protein
VGLGVGLSLGAVSLAVKCLVDAFSTAAAPADAVKKETIDFGWGLWVPTLTIEQTDNVCHVKGAFEATESGWKGIQSSVLEKSRVHLDTTITPQGHSAPPIVKVEQDLSMKQCNDLLSAYGKPIFILTLK